MLKLDIRDDDDAAAAAVTVAHAAAVINENHDANLWMLTYPFPYSDGIARVHGMANVQAEELVEYVPVPNLTDALLPNI